MFLLDILFLCWFKPHRPSSYTTDLSKSHIKLVVHPIQKSHCILFTGWSIMIKSVKSQFLLLKYTSTAIFSLQPPCLLLHPTRLAGEIRQIPGFFMAFSGFFPGFGPFRPAFPQPSPAWCQPAKPSTGRAARSCARPTPPQCRPGARRRAPGRSLEWSQRLGR